MRPEVDVEYSSLDIFGYGDTIYCGHVKRNWLNMLKDLSKLSIF